VRSGAQVDGSGWEQDACGTERSGRHPLSAARLPRVLSSGRRDHRVDTLAQRTLGRGRLFPPRRHLVREEDPGRIPLPARARSADHS